MTQAISFINMKGGVGKTTLCVNIAYTLSEHYSKKVLLIDIDPQFNATQTLFSKFQNIEQYREIQNNRKTIRSILVDDLGGITTAPTEYTYEDIITSFKTKKGNLDLIPGDLQINGFESSKRGDEKKLQIYIEDNILQLDFYDYILIDTPATYSIFSQSALLTSDYYIVPIAPDLYSSIGYDLLKSTMSKDLLLRDKEIKEAGIIFTLDKPEKVGRENIRATFDKEKIFENRLKENEYIRTGSSDTLMYDMSITRDNIVSITDEFINRLQEV